MNSSFLVPTGTALQMLGLSLLIGGMLALGAFTAPVLFKQFPRAEAGEAMTVMFRRYDNVLLAGLLMVIGGELLRVLPIGIPSLNILTGVRYGLMLVLIGSMLYSLVKVNPEIESLQRAGVTHGTSAESQHFTATHKLSEKLYKMEMALATIVLILTPFV